MKRVLHINSYGAYNLLFSNLYLEQKEQGLQLLIYEFAAKGAENETVVIPDALKNDTVRDYCYNGCVRYFFPLKHRAVFASCKKKIPSLGHYDIAHAHSLFSNGYIAYQIKRQFGVPYIVTVRNTDLNNFFGKIPLFIPLGVRLLREAARVVFISEAYRDETLQLYIPEKQREGIWNKSVVVPNGIDLFWHQSPFSAKEAYDGKRLRVLTIGAINRNKNQVAVAQALGILEAQGYEVDYTVVGVVEDAKVECELKQYPFVTMQPPQPKERLIEYYRCADIFVLASYTESFGLVYAEALSQSLPIIYTEKQGFDRQFANGFVGYSTKTDPGSIAEAIQKVVLQYGELQSHCVAGSRCFDWKRIALTYDALYNGIVDS